MPWAVGTKVGLTVSGADLVLDEGRTEGTYETTAVDQTILCWRRFDALVRVTRSGADASEPGYSVEIKTSPDNVTWTAYQSYRDGEYYCRCFQMRITIKGSPAHNQRPVLNQFENSAPPCDAIPWQGNVLTTETTPPAAAKRGDRYLCGASVDPAWPTGWIAICEQAGAGFRLVPPIVGQQLYHADEDVVKLRDPSGAWVDADVRKISTGHITILAPSWDSKPAGTWAAWVDANQYMNGGYVNTSGGVGDSILYKTCLKKATYTMLFFHSTSATGGSIKIYKDAILAPNLLATINTFSGGTVYNVESRTTGIVLTVARLYDIIVVVDAAGAGGGKDCEFSYLAFWRTA
jgi:hypothetical protein